MWIPPTGTEERGRFEWRCSGQTYEQLWPEKAAMDEALVLVFVGAGDGSPWSGSQRPPTL